MEMPRYRQWRGWRESQAERESLLRHPLRRETEGPFRKLTKQSKHVLYDQPEADCTQSFICLQQAVVERSETRQLVLNNSTISVLWL